MVHCVKLMLKIFEFEVLLFDCLVYCQNVNCFKSFTRYGHYAGEVEDIIIGRLAVMSLTIRSVYLTCSKKLTGSQLSLPRGINKKIKMRN